jgi:hypothetical protein
MELDTSYCGSATGSVLTPKQVVSWLCLSSVRHSSHEYVPLACGIVASSVA